MDEHLGDESLARFMEGSLVGPERELAEAHMAACGRCLDILVAARQAAGHRRRRFWPALATAAAALVAIGIYLISSQGGASGVSRFDVEAFVRSQRDLAAPSNPLWKTTLATWEDLSSVPVASLDSEEQQLLGRTMQKRLWVEGGLSLSSKEFVRRMFDERIRSTLSAPAPAPSASAAWSEIAIEAETVEAIARTRELHPWVLRRFVDRCEELIAAVDDREYDEQLRRQGITRRQVVQRLRDLVSE